MKRLYQITLSGVENNIHLMMFAAAASAMIIGCWIYRKYYHEFFIMCKEQEKIMSVLEVNNVSIRYKRVDIREIGLKEYLIHKPTGNYVRFIKAIGIRN